MKKKFLIVTALLSLLFIGCSDQTKEEAKEVSNNTIDKVAEVSEKTVDKTTEIVENVKKEAEPVIDKVVEKSKEAVESSKDMISKVTDSAVQVKDNIKQKIHTATAPSIDGKALYTKCVACHGKNAEKKALNTSKVIKGWQSKQIADALLGYKNGTYGGAMKSIMQGQVSKLNEDEIQALASYISTL
jgi:cytochrome c553